MLVGYSLEICLKAMLIIKQGISVYAGNEKTYSHHRLVDLASFIPNLNAKDKAILQVLSHFTVWAGRYPDPGSGRIDNVEEVFSLSEAYKISAKDLFELASRILKHTVEITSKN